MKNSLLAVSCATLSLFCAPAFAEALTEKSIQAFIDKSTSLSHQNNGMTDDQITDFLDDHVARGAVFTSQIMYDIPGQPAQMRQLVLNKSDFIKQTIEGRNTMQDYTSSVILKKTDINGDQANIVIETTDSGRAPMNGTAVNFEGKSSCNQVLKEDGGTIVVMSAACETIISFKE